ncbi:MAG: NAD(+)/NADH kinase, partial [Candidatus Marinimicrobia bacterium]|nr:NAD(+)/NADH kinase [Candidatus Neomarinimicrobiota bacterium]
KMKLGIIANNEKIKKDSKFFIEFITWLKDNNANFIVEKKVSKFLPNSIKVSNYSENEILKLSDIIIVIGGDGTILSTVKKISMTEKPIVGIHIGRLGFLAEITMSNFKDNLNKIIAGKYSIEKRAILKASVNSNNKITTFFALNDFVVSKGTSSRMIEFQVDINSNFMNSFKADGLIVSTPTGSTAYSLSNNGPILTPDLKGMILNPICPHILTNRPMVITDDKKIEINLINNSEDCIFTADGQNDIKLDLNSQIKIEKASFNANLIRIEGSNYFKTLRNKLRWGKN